MGRVGSYSIQEGLDILGIDSYRAHYFPQLHDREKSKDPDVINGLKIYNKFKSKDTKKIITAVREPVSYVVSASIQALDMNKHLGRLKYNDKKLLLERFEEAANMHMKQEKSENVVITMIQNYFSFPNAFFENFTESIGINFLDKDFKTDWEYYIYEEKTCDILIIKFEKLVQCANEAINKFLNIENYKLGRKNLSSKKIYWKMQKEVEDKLKFSKAFLDEIYKSPYIANFYSTQEIQGFKDRWGK